MIAISLLEAFITFYMEWNRNIACVGIMLNFTEPEFFIA